MQVLISHTDYAHLWRYINGSVIKLTLRNFRTHNLTPTDTPPVDASVLPVELKSKIIVMNFMNLIKDYNFEDACDMLVDHFNVTTIYKRLYPGKNILNCGEMITRIYRTLHLMETFHDDYLTCPNYQRMENVAIRLTHLGALGDARTGPLNPWDFRTDIRLEEYATDLESKIYHTGPDLGDSVLIGGEFEHGVIHCKAIYHPMITIILSDKADVLLPTESTFWRNKNFICFSRLLRRAFGPNAGIFYMVRRDTDYDNVFVTSSDVIVAL